MRELYVARVAEVAGMDRDVLLREVANEEKRPAVARPSGDGAAATAGPRPTYGGGGSGSGGRWRDEPAPAPHPDDSTPEVTFVEPGRQRDDGYKRNWEQNRRKSKFRREEDWKSSLAVPRVAVTGAVLRAEGQLIRAMVQERDLVELVAEKWPPESFNRGELRLVFERLLEEPEQPLDVLTQGLPAEVVPQLDRLLELEDPNPQRTVHDWVSRLQAMALDEEVDRLQLRVQASLDDAEKDGVILRIQALRKERAALSTHFSHIGPRRRG